MLGDWKIWKSFGNKVVRRGFFFVPMIVVGRLLFSPFQVAADGPPPFPGGGGDYGGGDGGTNEPPQFHEPFDYGQGLYLLPPALVSSNALVLTITNPVPGAAYDLLCASNVNQLVLTNWPLLGHFAPGQQTFTVSSFSAPQGYYVLRQSLDSDSDGTPDYLEDLNGNGVVDSGETDPNSSTDLGLSVQITTPQSGGRVL